MLLFLLLATFVACTKKCGVPETKFHRSRSVRPMAEYKKKGGCEKFCYSSRGRRRRSEFGGESTTLGLLPWMVRLETPIDEEGSAETELRSPPNLCTGVLVTMKKILTVGECETEDELVATVGHVTMFEDDVEGRLQTRKVLTETQKIDGTGFIVYKVDSAFEYTKYAMPICLPKNNLKIKEGHLLYTQVDRLSGFLLYQTTTPDNCRSMGIKGKHCLQYLYCNDAKSANMGSPIVAKVKGRMTLVGLRQSCETSEETYLEIDSATAQKINPQNGNKQQRKMP